MKALDGFERPTTGRWCFFSFFSREDRFADLGAAAVAVDRKCPPGIAAFERALEKNADSSRPGAG